MRRDRRRVLEVIVGVVTAICASAVAYPAATRPSRSHFALEIDTTRPGSELVVGAVGLSVEAAELNRGRLTAQHPRLVRLMRLLGPSVLRIGGGTVDRSWWTSRNEAAPPWATNIVTPADLEVLHGLLVATHWRVLLGVDLGHFEPARVEDEASYAREILGDRLLGVELGNEPNSYASRSNKFRATTYNVQAYFSDAQAYRSAMTTAAPNLSIYGPALSEPEWLPGLGSSASMFAELTQHYYPIHELGTCPAAPSSPPRATAEELLSPEIRAQEDILLEDLGTAARSAHRPTRIDETNSVSCRPNVYANPGFAGALWSLDWILRATDSGVRALNFHGGPYPCILYPESPICTPGDGAAATAGDIAAQPEYYGLLAARQLEGGRFLPTDLTGPRPLPNVTTWATVTRDGTVKVAIDDLAAAGRTVSLSVPSAGYVALVKTLAAPSPSATSNITFGGVAVSRAGQWEPKTAIELPKGRAVHVSVRPASATILTLRPIDKH